LDAFSSRPDYSASSRFKTVSKPTVKINNLLNVDGKKEQQAQQAEAKAAPDEAFTPEQLRAAWMEFAEQRKMYQAEYHLLNQAYQLNGSQIVVRLLNPVHETMLNGIKSELSAFLRERMKNNSIGINGEMNITEDKHTMYTSREKFEHLAGKNPALNELKDRLGLDTDF
jgi:DNA polymerase-3 subunit gamma/tau